LDSIAGAEHGMATQGKGKGDATRYDAHVAAHGKGKARRGKAKQRQGFAWRSAAARR